MKSINYSSFNFNLLAGRVEEIEQQGANLFLRDSSGDIEIIFDSPSNDRVPVKKGETVETAGFSKIYLVSAINQTVHLVLSPAGSISVKGISVIGEIVVSGMVAPTLSAFSVVELFAANNIYSLCLSSVDRKEITFIADYDNGAAVYLIPTGAVAGQGIANGIKLEPGESYTSETGLAWSSESPEAAQKIRVISALMA